MRRITTIVAISSLLLACNDAEEDEAEDDAGHGEDICANTGDCIGDLICAYGLCRPPCTYDRDCEEGACVTSPGESDDKTCLVANEGREECPGDLVRYEDELCRDSCESEEDCGDGRDCDEGACVDSP